MVKKLLFILVIGSIAVFAVRAWATDRAADTNFSKVQEMLQVATPTPMPYAEMTIPYLRERAYTSKLREQAVYAERGNYTAYTTSYNSEGFRINGLLTKPKGEQPVGGWPAIVFVHGYIPPTTYQTTGNYADYVDYLARNGFVVFKIDLRGHGNSDGVAGGGYYSSDYVIDTLNAHAALASSGFVHPDKIGLWGHSMAGNVTLRAMAAKPEVPALVIWAGAVYTYLDQREFGINDNSYRPPESNTARMNRRRELFEKVGSPSAQSAFWAAVAPTNYLKDLKGAIALHHAVDDDVVDIGYTRGLKELLEATRVPHEVHEYPSGGHNITGANFVSAMDRTVAFFTKYLQ